jgi:tRNA 2-thiocytidine biosynthesis protein TtcA
VSRDISLILFCMSSNLLNPPWNQRGKKIESMVRKALYDFSLVEDASPIGVALSGGKDSITLLAMLKAILGRGFPKAPLHAFHVGGPYSCGAGVHPSFLKNICDSLEIPLTSLESSMTLETLSCYPCSRNRRSLIFEAAKEQGIYKIAFGHHREDHIQTLLMNLLHKGEFAGNLASVKMREYGVEILRPLLYVAESEIWHFAKTCGFARVTCQCPVGQDSMRKKVESLIGEIEELFPNVRDNLAHAGLKYGSKKAQGVL